MKDHSQASSPKAAAPQHEPEAALTLKEGHSKKDDLGGAGVLPHEPTNSRSHSKPAHRQAATATHRPAPQPPSGKKPEWDDRCCTAGDDGLHVPVALYNKLEAKVAEERSLEAKRRETLKRAQREYSRPFSARAPRPVVPWAHGTERTNARGFTIKQPVHTLVHPFLGKQGERGGTAAGAADLEVNLEAQVKPVLQAALTDAYSSRRAAYSAVLDCEQRLRSESCSLEHKLQTKIILNRATKAISQLAGTTMSLEQGARRLQLTHLEALDELAFCRERLSDHLNVLAGVLGGVQAGLKEAERIHGAEYERMGDEHCLAMAAAHEKHVVEMERLRSAAAARESALLEQLEAVSAAAREREAALLTREEACRSQVEEYARQSETHRSEFEKAKAKQLTLEDKLLVTRNKLLESRARDTFAGWG